MQHGGTHIIRTPRLIIRPFSGDDGPAMFRNWASDSRVTAFLTWPPHTDPEQTAQLCHIWAAAVCSDSRRYIWALEEPECGEAIGSLSVVSMDEHAQTMELGYCLGRAWWGQGLMTEAVTHVLSYLFEHTSVQVIRAAHDTANPASGRVMDKSGMLREGIARGTGINNQGVRDILWHSITRREYEERAAFPILELHDPEAAAAAARGVLSPDAFRDSGHCICLAHMENGNVLGAVLLCPTSPSALSIAGISVLPDRRRQGIGQRLIASAKHCATRDGFSCLHALIPSGSPDQSRAFLASAGFRELGPIPGGTLMILPL